MQPKLIATLVFAALVGLPMAGIAADKGGGPGATPGKSDMPTSPPSGLKSDAPRAGGTSELKADQPAPKGAGALNFNRLDRNNDGFISAEEAKGGDLSGDRFKELDKDGDGKISREEAGGQMPGTPGGVSDTKKR